MFTTKIENSEVSTESCENPVIELVAVTDSDLVTVTGGRNYGWQGGGWTGNGSNGGLGNGGVLPSVNGGNIGDDGGTTNA